MKFTQAEIAKLTLPAGKDDIIVWDDDLPGFGVRLRRHSQAYIIQGRSDGRQWRVKIGDVRRIKLEAARGIARRKFAHGRTTSNQSSMAMIAGSCRCVRQARPPDSAADISRTRYPLEKKQNRQNCHAKLLDSLTIY
jgi:hypothetical protein